MPLQLNARSNSFTMSTRTKLPIKNAQASQIHNRMDTAVSTCARLKKSDFALSLRVCSFVAQ